MAKNKTKFICQKCGSQYPKWTGRCENCGDWNSLVEQVIETGKSAMARSIESGKVLKSERIGQTVKESPKARLQTGFADMDNVLGGGIVPGGVVLLAGQPGIGKSTLLMQVALNFTTKGSILYVSGEESASQVGLRAQRLGGKSSNDLEFISSTSADDIVATIRASKYDLVIIDSIQTLSLSEITSAPGTVSQITNSSNAIIRSAKESNSAVILVGHVTKEGSIAGPKVLEHLVDVVLQFDGDRYGGFKVLRAVKNRYGSTEEAAIFEMTNQGLAIVKNPSASLLEERQDTDGSIVLATLEGNRPLLVEIQALVNSTNFGYPKRTASGFDINRLNILVAVLEKRTKLKLADKDIYINIVGGIKLDDPASDLAVCMAIASASVGMKLKKNAVVFGEVGLGGEVRSARLADKRVNEAKKIGFDCAIGPKQKTKNDFILPVNDMRQALVEYLNK